MTTPEIPDLDDVIDPHEHAHPDHREHAKAQRPDDDLLARRAEQERREVARDRGDVSE